VKFLLATCVVEKNVEALLAGLPLHGFNLGGNLAVTTDYYVCCNMALIERLADRLSTRAPMLSGVG
jgi:hypothetical protein